MSKAKVKNQEGISVEKGIPIDDYPKPARRSKYPWAQMAAVGDSFEVEVVNPKLRSKKAAELRSQARSWAKRNKSPAKFDVRITDKGVRIWRVE